MSSSAHASSADLFGFGARGIAMGGAVATSSSGASAAYYNPAGLAFAQSPTFTIGYQYAGASLSIADNPHPFEPVAGVSLGVGLPLPFGGALKERLSMGLAFIIPEAAVLAAQTPTPSTPHFPLLDSRGQTVTLVTSLGIRLAEDLSVGAGVSVLAHLKGSVDAKPDSTGQIGARVRDTLVTDLAPLIGIRYTIGPCPISLTYRSASRATYDLPVSADLGDELPLALPTLSLHGTAQFDPSQVALEIAWQSKTHLLIAAGITYERWSDFENPIAFVATPESYPDQPPPEFRDTWSLKLGLEAPLELLATPITPRLGLAYQPTPAPVQTGYHNYLDNDRMLLSGGLAARFGSIELSLAFQLQALVERSATKDPSLTEPYPEYAYEGTLSHGGTMYLTTLDVSMEF